MPALLLLAALASRSPAAPRLDVEARAIKPGEVLLVDVEGEGPAAPQATLRGRPLAFFAGASTGSWLAFAAFDIDARPGPAPLQAVLRGPRGRVFHETRTLIVKPAHFAIESLAVAPRYVTPPKSDLERAEGEAAALHKLFERGETPRLFQGDFASPIPGARAAGFGRRRVFNGEPRAPHSGMDLHARRGTPVRAPAAGRVLMAGDLFFSGNTIILDHGLGLTTLYAHLSRMLVKPGEKVRKGQIIGRVGATGRVTGPHLHWALKVGEARVDPYSLVALDLDSKLKLEPDDPLVRSPACARPGLPPPTPWGRADKGLRARIRPLQESYEPGQRVSFLVEIRNGGRRAAFLDFVLDPAVRSVVLGFNRGPAPLAQPASDARARLATEQVKIPPGKTLCFEQDRDAAGPLLARRTARYALTYETALLYSTSTVRAGIWRGRLLSPPAVVSVK